jgi:ParB-like chromosome segregation protein Spo0J
MTDTTGRLMLVPPEDLTPHPMNTKIYGDTINDEFVDSIRAGLVEPVVATEDMTLVSGHRRTAAAVQLEWDVVPVIVRTDLKDPLDIEEALILANRQREKTTEQKAREFKRLKEIEEARSSKGGRGNKRLDQSSPTFSQRSDVKAAEAAGLGRTTAQKAARVVDAIDKAEASGDTGQADSLREALNSNVSKAHRRVSSPPEDLSKQKLSPQMEESFESKAVFTGLVQRLGKLRTDIFDLSSKPGGERLPLSQIRIDLNNVSEAVQSSSPHAVCPYCKGSGCKECDALGWMHKDRYSGIPEDRR